MSCGHAHSHHHHHDHSHTSCHGDGKIGWAVCINLVLTAAQFIGGIAAGSLALIADALHNFSDAGALLLALIARKIARRAPDEKRTYGYKKVETLAAFTNFIILVMIALWLGCEAVLKFLNPEPITGHLVLILAAAGFIINGATAMLIRSQAKNNQNMRAAYLHNITDAVSSLGVMVAGYAIMNYGWLWLDPAITLLISAYIIFHAMHDFPAIINILIDGKSSALSAQSLSDNLETIDGVKSVHHLHLRQLGEGSHALEAHVVLAKNADMDSVKFRLKERIGQLGIHHSTIEFEGELCASAECRC